MKVIATAKIIAARTRPLLTGDDTARDPNAGFGVSGNRWMYVGSLTASDPGVAQVRTVEGDGPAREG